MQPILKNQRKSPKQKRRYLAPLRNPDTPIDNCDEINHQASQKLESKGEIMIF